MTKYPGTFFLVLTSIVLQVLISVSPSAADALAFRPGEGLWGWAGLLTHMVAHANWAHLIGNFTFGIPALLFLEKKLGERKLLEFYVLCGLFSAAFQMLIAGGGGMIGSSGCLFGVMMGACLQFGETRTEHALGILYCLVLLIPQLAFAPLGALVGIAVYGHIGGAIGAFLLCQRLYPSEP